MKRPIRITSVRRDPIDTARLAQALIELVIYQHEQEELKAKQRRRRQPRRKEGQRDGS